MEIFLALVSLLNQGAKNGGDCGANANISVHEQSFRQVANNPMSVGPSSVQ